VNKTVHVDLGREPTDPPEARVMVRVCRTGLSNLNARQSRDLEMALLLLAAALAPNDELDAVTAEARELIERTRNWRQSRVFVR
jgi:hypothetical protein